MPITQTVVRAPESTENVVQARRVRDVSSRIAFLDPDSSPLTVISMRASSRAAVNSKFEWMEEELPARWDTVDTAATGHTATGTTVGVITPKFFSIGDIVNVPRTGEKMRVTAVAVVAAPGNNITVVRAVDGGSAVALAANDDLQIIGNAYPEGALSQESKTVQEDFKYNYTQITRTPVSATRTEEASENYGSVNRTFLRRRKAIEHKIDLERTLLYGIRNIDTSSVDNPRRYTGGLLYFLDGAGGTSKTKDFGGTVTEPEIEDFFQNVFQATGAGDSRTFACSPLWVSIMDQLAAGRISVTDRSETYGVTVRQWVTAHGTLNIVKHRLLENHPASALASPTGYAGYGLALDMPSITYRYIRGGQTVLREDIAPNDYDGWKDEYLTECGWQVELAKLHGVAKGATG